MHLKISNNFSLSLHDGQSDELTNTSVITTENKWFHLILEINSNNRINLYMNGDIVLSGEWFRIFSYKKTI